MVRRHQNRESFLAELAREGWSRKAYNQGKILGSLCWTAVANGIRIREAIELPMVVTKGSALLLIRNMYFWPLGSVNSSGDNASWTGWAYVSIFPSISTACGSRAGRLRRRDGLAEE